MNTYIHTYIHTYITHTAGQATKMTPSQRTLHSRNFEFIYGLVWTQDPMKDSGKASFDQGSKKRCSKAMVSTHLAIIK